MGVITIEALEDGQVLAADVHDVNGRLLLREGQVLEAKHRRVLKIWGITEVSVAGGGAAEDTGAEAVDTERLAAVEATVAVIFSQLDLTHGALAYLHACAIAHRYTHNRVQASRPATADSAADPSTLRYADIQRKVDCGGIKLPEAPTIVLKLNEVIAAPDASANDVAQVVGTSPSLTALILRIVNSAAFGLPVRVDRISRAVALLGTREISSLAMGVSVMQAFMDIPRDLIDMDAFLSHSLASATISRYLAALTNSNRTEQLFIAGLLHDIGKLILLKYFPQEFKLLFQTAWTSGETRPFYTVEKTAIGRTHAQIAGRLLAKWQFPEALQDMVQHHHTPSRSRTPSEAVLVQMADLIVNAVGLGSSGESVIPGFDQAAWAPLNIADGHLKTAIRQGEQQVRAMASILSMKGAQ